MCGRNPKRLIVAASGTYNNTGLHTVKTLKHIAHCNQGRSLCKTVQGHIVFDAMLALQVTSVADCNEVTFILVKVKCLIVTRNVAT